MKPEVDFHVDMFTLVYALQQTDLSNFRFCHNTCINACAKFKEYTISRDLYQQQKFRLCLSYLMIKISHKTKLYIETIRG